MNSLVIAFFRASLYIELKITWITGMQQNEKIQKSESDKIIRKNKCLKVLHNFSGEPLNIYSYKQILFAYRYEKVLI